MQYTKPKYLHFLPKPTHIHDFNCHFHVYRHKPSKHIISVALWKYNPNYIPSLSNALLWWNRNLHPLFPNFNLRIYLSYDLFYNYRHTPDPDPDIDWITLFKHIHNNIHIELWFYTCPFQLLNPLTPHKPNKPINPTTFGSIIRLHPLFDPNVHTTIIRNIELLSSKHDSLIIHQWSKTNFQFHSYMLSHKYGCFQDKDDHPSYLRLCNKFNLKNQRTILAWFSMKGTLPPPTKHTFFKTIQQTQYDFSYGIDELLLTKILISDNILSPNNTCFTLLIPSFIFLYQINEFNPPFTHALANTLSHKLLKQKCPLLPPHFYTDWDSFIDNYHKHQAPLQIIINQLFIKSFQNLHQICPPFITFPFQFFHQQAKHISHELLLPFSQIQRILASYIKHAFFLNKSIYPLYQTIQNIQDTPISPFQLNLILNKNKNELLDQTPIPYPQNIISTALIQLTSSLPIVFPGISHKTKHFSQDFKSNKHKFIRSYKHLMLH